MSRQLLDRPFKEYIQAIGRGKNAGRTLSQDEAYDAMNKLMSGQVTAEQRGAFLMLLRVREETAEELAGFSQALQAASNPQVSELGADLDMGCYAGKRRQHPWFIFSALLLAKTGRRIFLHGTSEPDSKRFYLDTALAQLGFAIPSGIEQAKNQIDKYGFTYLPLANINPQLNDLIQLRSQFGLRSCANTLARMLNPSRAPFSLQGVFHKHVDLKHQKTAALLGNTNVLTFRGEGGEIEYNPERDVELRFTRKQHIYDERLPAMQSDWNFKSKAIDGQYMIDVWSGKTENEYASHAVIGTFALMLMLLDKLDWKTAKKRAEACWLARTKQWLY